MKRGYKRLLIFQAVLFLFLIINSFVSSVLSGLSGYNTELFLLVVGIAFYFLFGFEKDNHRYIKDILFETAIFLLVYFLLYYLSGIFFSFAETGNYWTLYGFGRFIIPAILYIVMKEYLRYMMLTKSEGCKLLIVTTCILFTFLDVSTPLYYETFTSNYQSFIFLSLTLLPAISTNIVCSYVTMKVGYKPVMFYLLALRLYTYLLPIVPNPSAYIASVVNFLVPVLYGYRMYRFFKEDRDEEVEREYRKQSAISLIIPAAIIIFCVYITCGYFHFHAVAIASGSMTPNIRKGDVVVIEKLDRQFDKLKVGQVVAYRYNGVIIVHRLVDILHIGDTYYFYTKGDANPNVDGYTITEDMIIGTVDVKVPYIGLPTVWLNEL